MGCRRQGGRRHRFAIACWALGAVAAGLLSGCQQLSDLLGITDPWAGYYDASENFIAAHGLDQEDLTTAGYQRNALWTWAWRGQSDASDSTGFSYMTLTRNTTESPPSSLPASTPVYDLELLNLYPGGGDFEGAGVPPANWTANGTGVLFTAQTTSALIIHGAESMQIDAGSNSYAGFNLSALLDQSSPTATHTYNWRFFAKGSSYAFQSFYAPDIFNQNTSAYVTLSTSPVDYLLPRDLSVPPGTPTILAFGSNSPIQNFIFDDIRVFRSEIKDYCSLRLLLRPGDASHPLRDGFYEFTLWVRKSGSRSFVSEQAAKAPYAASRVTLSMLSLLPNPTGNQHAYPIDGSADIDGSVYDARSAWVRLALRASTLSINSSSTATVMEIAVFPFDKDNPDPGSVEIADPELHYYKDGY
ncbi:MAG: hypothetical protein M0001_11910 [Treponema sp.]|nr:hypothetical protein [Treponema sp.]